MGEHTAALELVKASLHQKYQQLDAYKNATAEMDKLLDESEDPTAFGIYVDMRENHIKRIAQIDAAVEAEIAKLPKALAGQVREALRKDGPAAFGETALCEIAAADKRNRELYAALVTLDSALAEKINAGLALGKKPPAEEDAK